MRILIKGGVWKNSEDEILKAAVMKYGLNNWPRVSSLLARKSPKQCKARWYEWLDPTVKKTEWTREEEEKLLHLAKLFPTQWRTIAPIVGRTANQCLEHYEKLLDQAQGKDEMDENDPRRLKPGEIDPHPETKPARADPIDMDEDEKEMLSEARARLANTRGKKAKRRAREKQLEEARRLATLQKQRELKAAGITKDTKYRKNRKYVDYATEIPFEAKPAIGFHAVGREETPKAALGLANVTLQSMEGKRRDEEEERMRKDDERKIKRLKGADMPAVMSQINKLNDPAPLLKRAKLTLPSPQLTDEELEQIVKMGADAAALSAASDADAATAGLVQSYGETPGQTPLRTPKMQNTVLLEAQDAIARNALQTPLAGQDNPSLNQDSVLPNAFASVLPKKQTEAVTPNTYAEKARSGMTPSVRDQPGRTPIPGRTPGHSSIGGTTPGATPIPGSTPGHSSSLGGSSPAHTSQHGSTPVGQSTGAGGVTQGTPTSTPFRDAYSLNQELENSEMPEKMRAQMAQMRIKAQLAAIPAPSNDIEISMPELGDEPEGDADQIEPDQADLDAQLEKQAEARRQAELKKRSQVIQRELPRPVVPDTMLFPAAYRPGADGPQVEDKDQLMLLDKAESLLHEEMKKMVFRDAFLYPTKGVKPAAPPEMEEYSLEDLQQATELIEPETRTQQEVSEVPVEFPGLEELLEENIPNYLFIPAAKKYQESKYVAKGDRLDSIKHSFGLLKAQMQKEAKRAKKMEDRVGRQNAGYQMKAKQSLERIGQLASERDSLGDEVEVFRDLRAREEKAIELRVGELKELVQKTKDRNQMLQKRYRKLKISSQILEDALA